MQRAFAELTTLRALAELLVAAYLARPSPATPPAPAEVAAALVMPVPVQLSTCQLPKR